MVGLGTAFIVGPVLFTLLRNSLQFGFVAGWFCATGIIVSDIVVMVLCYFTAGDVMDRYVQMPWLKFVAAAILMGLAFTFYFKKIDDTDEEKYKIGSGKWRSFYQGFLVNFVNPFVFLVWISFIALAKAKYGSENEVILSLLGVLIGIYITDISKAFAASFLSTYLKSELLATLFKVIAIILGIVAIRLVFLGLESYV